VEILWRPCGGGSAHPPPASSRSRILVIDDEEAIRSALSRALAAEGLVTDLAETAADGLSRARAEVYDLVILDLLMPGMDGFAALRQLLRDRRPGPAKACPPPGGYPGFPRPFGCQGAGLPPPGGYRGPGRPFTGPGAPACPLPQVRVTGGGPAYGGDPAYG
jgi:hypothetical protein